MICASERAQPCCCRGLSWRLQHHRAIACRGTRCGSKDRGLKRCMSVRVHMLAHASRAMSSDGRCHTLPTDVRMMSYCVSLYAFTAMLVTADALEIPMVKLL